MIKIYSAEKGTFLKKVNKSEVELNRFLSENWGHFFPQYTFVKSEFTLDGNVRSRGTSGRIDILAFNPKTNRFVVIELKRDIDKNIRNQVSDYRDFIEDNFAKIYLLATQKFNITLPKYETIAEDSIEVVMIAKSFSQTDIDKARKSSKEITLIKYVWFENQLLLIDYLNNDPDDLIEKENAEKIKKIKSIIDNKPELADADSFLFGKEEAKRLFKIFYEYLKNIGDVQLDVQASKIKVSFGKQGFSVIGYAGKTGRKCHLVINTNIDTVKIMENRFDDRMRKDGKMKGSIGSERYEVFITTEDDLFELLKIIESDFNDSSSK